MSAAETGQMYSIKTGQSPVSIVDICLVSTEDIYPVSTENITAAGGRQAAAPSSVETG